MAISYLQKRSPGQSHRYGSLMSVFRASGRYELSDLKSTVKKVLTYLSASLLVAPLYLAALCVLHFLSIGWVSPAGIATIVIMIFGLPWLMMTLQKPIERKLDEILYKERLSHRRMLLTLPRRLSNVLNINELGEGLLQPIPRALKIPNASLLLPGNGHFSLQFSNQLLGVDPPPPLKLSHDSPVVRWL